VSAFRHKCKKFYCFRVLFGLAIRVEFLASLSNFSVFSALFTLQFVLVCCLLEIVNNSYDMRLDVNGRLCSFKKWISFTIETAFTGDTWCQINGAQKDKSQEKVLSLPTHTQPSVGQMIHEWFLACASRQLNFSPFPLNKLPRNPQHKSACCSSHSLHFSTSNAVLSVRRLTDVYLRARCMLAFTYLGQN
jgi:hypothetical protein